ncbi:MAG: hypothetical protein JWP97_4880 [Labilithrix sp.]|nr:hypothetical protein [Labilithrix sp.]
MSEPTSSSSRRSSAVRIANLAGVVAVVGLVGWLVLARGAGSEHAASTSSLADGPVLPPYEVAGGALHVRGPTGRFELLLRPTAPSSVKIVAYAFTMDAEDADPNPLDAQVEVLPGAGSVRFRGDGRALRGAREVRVVVGIANASITKFEDALTAARTPGGGSRLVTLRVPIVRE